MKNLIAHKELPRLLRKLHRRKSKIVFTNGVFDIIHRGHVNYLSEAKKMGDVLIVGLNSDISTRRLKGARRPIFKQIDRAAVLLALAAVDFVVIFSEDTPAKLIEKIKPDVLVKGADYKLSEIAGAAFVKARGGRVRRIKLTAGRSTTAALKKLKLNG
ncbi:MAG: D-glycero-beta-D-manno-heptose 1-phosphate adenylyltransferase [candidate division Zixibacteria bacterium]|nr:D-glycero-beta-D-manno-heptose 1-phosphate adenylyltransferase [candidate division Zixibacteria bacterium]